MKQKTLEGLVSAAAESGAKILVGGHAPPDCPKDSCWMMPTIVAEVPPGSELVQEELFGPVVALMTAENLDDALRLHNEVGHGLLGTLYSNDVSAQSRFLSDAEAGILLLNRARPEFSPDGPFSGWKLSGHGLAEHGRWNRDFYTQVQVVYRGS